MKDLEKATYDLAHTEADLHYFLCVFGDELAKRYGYKAVDGLDAVHFHLCVTHHWTPAAVRSMTSQDLQFLLQEEMHGWTVPKGSQPPRKGKRP